MAKSRRKRHYMEEGRPTHRSRKPKVRANGHRDRGRWDYRNELGEE